MKNNMRGFGLIEMMISMVIGLIAILGLVSIMISNGAIFRTIESQTKIQESFRFAFEKMADDIRNAGSTPCGAGPVALTNSLLPIPSDTNWTAGFIRGFDGSTPATGLVSFGTGYGDRVAGTDALLIMRTVADKSRSISSHSSATGIVSISGNNPFVVNDYALLCDETSSAIIKVATVSSLTVSHTGGLPLGYPSGAKDFNNGRIGLVSSGLWYVGYNGRTFNGELGRSLFFDGQEIVNNVFNMTIGFAMLNTSTSPPTIGNYESVSAVTDWGNTATSLPVAVTIEFTGSGEKASGINTSGTVDIDKKRVQSMVVIRNRGF